MNTANDDDLLNGEEFDYEEYSLDGDQEEELLQDDFEEETNNVAKGKKRIFGVEVDDDEEEEDVLTLGLDDEERFDKSLVDDATSIKDKPTKTVENKPKPIPTTTNNVNSKKISSTKPWDRPPPTTKTLTTHERNLNGKRNQKKIDNSWRGIHGGRGSFNPRPRSDFQKRRNGTVLINPRYKGTVSVNENARLAWDVNSQPPANYIQPWASGVPTPSNNPSIQNTLINLVSHLRNSVDIPPNTFNSNMSVQQNDYFQAPSPVVHRNVFDHPPVFQQAPSAALSQMQPVTPTYGQIQLPYNTYGGGNVPNQFNRQISNDRLQVDNNRSYNTNEQFSYRGRNENFQSDYSQSPNNYYSNYRNEIENPKRNNYGGENFSNNYFNRNFNNYNRNNRKVFVQRNTNKNNNDNKKKIETNHQSTTTTDLTIDTAKKPRLLVIPSDHLISSSVNNNEQVHHKRIMFEENRTPTKDVARSQSVEDEEMRLYCLKIEEQKRLREEVLRRKEENRKKVAAEEQRRRQEEEEFLRRQEEDRLKKEEERLKIQQEEERIRNQQEQERIRKQDEQMSAKVSLFQQAPVGPANYQHRIFSTPKVPPVTICRPKFETAMPKVVKFERLRENITIIPTDDFTNRTFTIKNNLPNQIPTNETTQSTNTFRTERVVTMKNTSQPKHMISPWANAINPGVESSNLTFSRVNSKDSTKGGSGDIDEQFSSFFNNRKVLKYDKHLLNTRLVTISNLSASTDERKLESLTHEIGEIQKLRLDAAQRKATILFKTVATAQNFYKKYQRHMLDLSMIEVKLEPML